jgi:tRNA A37 threonylcarbamoyladenosine synthetase subunit TsaC/SUA5/YrdC
MPGLTHRHIPLAFNDTLCFGHVNELCNILRSGGLLILPSDTCYALAGIPDRRDVLATIASLLPHTRNQPIPLSFGSLNMLRRWVKLVDSDYRVIDNECPGPITLVCEIASELASTAISQALHTNGTIGIRIPASHVERQISIELDHPITTCAIRDDTGHEIRKYDDALDIIRQRSLSLQNQIFIAGVHMPRIRYSEHSTVVTVQPNLATPYTIHIYRPGAVDAHIIEGIVRTTTYRDVEDFT